MPAKVRPPRKKDRVFNDFKRQKLLRKRIPVAEAAVGLAVLVFVALMIGWVGSRREAFDPGERDLDLRLLEGKAPGELYTRPLQRWTDPSAPRQAAAVDIAPFPASFLADGWRPATRVDTFTPDNVYEKINGQAEQYHAFGFRALHVVTLEDPSGAPSLDVFLYEQGSFAESVGLAAEQRAEKPLLTRGSVWFTPTSVGAMGRVGRYVFHLIGSEPGEAIAAKTERLVTDLSAFAGDGAAPEPFTILHEGLGIPLSGIGYTPRNAFRLGFARSFWFGAPRPGEPTRTFLHWAESADDAREMVRRLQEGRTGELEAVASAGWYSVSRHGYLKTIYTLGREGQAVFGVEDHPDRDAAVAMTEQLRDAVRAASEPETEPEGG